MIKIDNRIELALDVIELKKADLLRNREYKSYEDYKATLQKLNKEKEEVFSQNESVIEKVLTDYLCEVKN